jgi:hypothetical protein
MALVIKDRVKETTTTTGTGTYTLAGAETGYQAFSVIGDGNTTYYVCSDGTEWEVGIGTYSAAGTALARTTILSSSNSDSAVDWSAGEKFIFVAQPASKAVYNDADDKFATGDHFSSFITFDAIDHPTHAEGQVYYDTNHKSLSYQSDIDGVEHEIGIEEHVRVYNNSGSTINKGKPVYWSGNANDHPTIGLANATSETKYNVQGLTAHDIANDSYGYVIVSGLVDGIDTSALTAGQNVFAGLSDGALRNDSPTYPNFPMCLGWVVKSHPTDGIILINQQNHSVNSFRVRTDAHVGGDLIVGGDLTVQGTQTSASSNNVSLGASFQYLNAGDTIGESGTTFTGTGNDDAYFTGHYNGTTTTTYYVKIDGDQSNPDTFSWSKDNFATTEATGVDIVVGDNALDNGISINFADNDHHTLNDVWSGTASPANVDTGLFTNYNTGGSGVGYTHAGFFWDASTAKWTLLSEYDPEPEGTINVGHASATYGTLKAGTFEGDLSGDVTGDVTGSLTGTADTANTLDAADNQKAQFGDSNDLEIYHAGGSINHIYGLTGSSTYITGGTDLYLRGVNGEEGVTINGNGSVELFHDNSKKAETTATGLSITNTLDVGTIDLGDWTITESGGSLIFQYQGTTKFSMDTSGTMKVANDVETDATF